MNSTHSNCLINLGAIRRNFRRLGEPAGLMPVVKSDAYGHGLLPVAKTLAGAGARSFAVGALDEGLALREAGLEQEIFLLLGCLSAAEWAAAREKRLVPLLTKFEDLDRIGSEPTRVGLKFQTGMGRLGFTLAECGALLDALRARPWIEPVMAFSHLAVSENPDEAAYTRAQMLEFSRMHEAVSQLFPGLPRSLGNSGATLGWSEMAFEALRPGLAVYGGNPFARTERESLGSGLEWAMSLSAAILQIRRLGTGESVSYGRIFTAPCPMTVAVVSIGYAQGFSRCLSNRISLLVNGFRARQIGRVCMSMLMLDVSRVPEVAAGDRAWILGGEAAPGEHPVDAQEIADAAESIPYEALCLFGSLNSRSYCDC